VPCLNRRGVRVTGGIVLRPGRTPLADWRAIRHGEAVALDSSARIDVEAGRAALKAILSETNEPLDRKNSGPSVADLIEARGEILPETDLRLFTALKLSSLAQGVSGVRWELVEALSDLLADGLLPAVPEGADDRLALSHLFAALTGAGEILYRGRIRPAAEILRAADMRPLSLDARERGALLSGTALSVATALGALFAAERVFQSALVAMALSAQAAGQPNIVLHATVHRLNRQRGQSEVAEALRALAPRDDGEKPQALDTNADRSAILRTGAALDLLRHAAALLERAANSVAESRLVLWQSEEIVAGAEDATSAALAADLIAMALTTLGNLAAGRIAAHAPESADPEGSAETAASMAAENRGRAGVPALDPAGIWRLRPLVDSTAEIVAIELLEGARLCKANGGLADAVAIVRGAVPAAEEADGFSGRDIRAVADLVRTGALASASGTSLPAVVSPQAARTR
jgi:histidine ammonia-lyase